MSARKLWKVRYGNGSAVRPESKVKAYGIYVYNARAAYLSYVESLRTGNEKPGRVGPGRFVEVWVDERDGQGWQLHERVDLAAEVTP